MYSRAVLHCRALLHGSEVTIAGLCCTVLGPLQRCTSQPQSHCCVQYSSRVVCDCSGAVAHGGCSDSGTQAGAGALCSARGHLVSPRVTHRQYVVGALLDD